MFVAEVGYKAEHMNNPLMEKNNNKWTQSRPQKLYPAIQYKIGVKPIDDTGFICIKRHKKLLENPAQAAEACPHLSHTDSFVTLN